MSVYKSMKLYVFCSILHKVSGLKIICEKITTIYNAEFNGDFILHRFDQKNSRITVLFCFFHDDSYLASKQFVNRIIIKN